MEGYLGETKTKIKDTKYKGYKKSDWARYFIEQYGQYDGGHHKQWTMDQVMRILLGTKVKIKIARWSNGQFEHRVSLGEPSNKYKNWVIEMKDGEDGPDTYGYDEGIAP
jgi:hypothetical protein